MLFYLAGCGHELDRCHAFARQLTAAGWTDAHDWRVEMRAHLAEGKRDADLPVATRRATARTDLDAVRRADVLVFLVPSAGLPAKGAWVELGYALARRDAGEPVRVHVVGDGPGSSLFCELADTSWTDESAFLGAVRESRAWP